MILVSEKAYKLLESKIDGLKKEERVEKDADQRKTYDEVFDQLTLMNIYKLIINKQLDTVECPISTGKEANVFLGTQPDGELVALKIYRTSTATFKNLRKYIDGDPRFRNVKTDHRSLVYTWARKEYKNLKRMQDGQVRVPMPITYNQNILMMEFIGHDRNAAPMLREINIDNPKECLDILINTVERLYNECRMVHGDLSEYNVLIPDDDIVVIDVGQSVLLDHPMAEELFERDVKNLVRYFEKYGLSEDPAGIIEKIQAGSAEQNDNNDISDENITDE